MKDEELRGTVIQAARDRFCPDVELLMEKEPSEELKRHLEKCPFCRETLADSEGMKEWEKLVELVNETLSKRSVPDEVFPGQIWQLAQTCGGWGAHDLYYHAPQVLVLAVYPYNVVRVAQISPFASLAGKGDVPLGTVPVSGFAEMWNVYSVPESWLDLYLGSIPGARLVSAFMEETGDGPETGSLMDEFRQQELTHSVHFSMGALEEVMALAENWEEERNRRIIDAVHDFLVSRRMADWNLIPCYCQTEYAPQQAAASSRLTLSLPEGDNVCAVEYEGGRLCYGFDYIPRNSMFVVLLCDRNDDPVEVQSADGSWQNYVVVDSDEKEVRNCHLSAEEFEHCSLKVYLFPRVEERS